MNKAPLVDGSYLVSIYFIGFTLVMTFLSAYYGFTTLSGYLFFACVLSGVAYLWGHWSAHGIEVDIQSPSRHVYPGEDIVMTFTLENNKCLPLLWLEWMQSYPKNHCLDIPDDFEVAHITLPDVDATQVPVLCKGFSFIKWYASVTWTSTFRAARRGVYIPQTIDIQTGDGFGLSAEKITRTLPQPPVFVVYPQRVDVSTHAFFKNAWSATTGPQGIVEDVTVLRGTRDYAAHDSFKRINWRLEARGGGLQVNLYDTIAPRTVYFFLDTATFHGISEDNQAFEETLSVVGSLISELVTLDMSVELYLPTVSEKTALSAGVQGANDCLLALALADCDHPQAQFSQEALANLVSTQSGNIYYVCYDGQTAPFATLFEPVGIGNFTVVSHQEPSDQSGALLSDVSVTLVSTFQKG